MYKILANTLFMGKKLVYVPECHSTNQLAMDLAQKGAAIDGALVITDHQTAGRGQRGNAWLANAGENFTFSIIVQPTFLPVEKQFQITQAVSLGICRYLEGRLSAKIQIKWPNDILADQKKICGILIENQLTGNRISHTVVGIGLNVNQTDFEFSQATSMRLISGQTFALNSELEILTKQLERTYLQLKSSGADLHSKYLDKLYRYGEIHKFSSLGERWTGKIIGTDLRGRLLVERDGITTAFDIKEIQFET